MISYKIATDEEIKNLYDQFPLTTRITWPTVLAKQEGNVIGFLCTQDNPEYVIAGPFQAESSVVALRLAEVYEVVMRGIGIKEYWFSVDKDKEEWLEVVNKIGLYTRVEEDEEVIWFKRSLGTLH